MARLRYNGLTATLDGAGLTAAATSIGFTAALSSMAGAVPTLAAGDYIVLVVDGEIVHLTAYTTGALTGTIERAKEGTTAATHAAGATVENGPTVDDFAEPAVVLYPDQLVGANDQAKINAAVAQAYARFDAGSCHVVIQLEAREYLLTDAPTHPDGASGPYAQIRLPRRASTVDRVVLEFRGVATSPVSPNDSTTAQSGGTVIRSTSTAVKDATYGIPSVIGGPALNGSSSTFSNVTPVLSGLTIQRPSNPSIMGADFSWCAQAKVRDCSFDTYETLAAVPTLTNWSGIALHMPLINNNAMSEIEGVVYILGSPVALRFGEHLTANHLVIYKCGIGLAPASAYHGSVIKHANVELTKHIIADVDLATGPTSVATSYLHISMLDIEDAADGSWFLDTHILDAANNLHASGWYVRVKSGVGTQTGALTRTGAGTYTNLTDLTAAATSSGGAVEILPPDLLANRPAATSVPSGSLFPATDTDIIYQSNGTVWGDWFQDTTGAGTTTPDTWHQVGTGTEPAFANSWVNYGAGEVPASFTKVNGIVYVTGAVKSGTLSGAAKVFTLPVGYRPAAIASSTGGWSFPTTSNNAFGRLTVLPNGDVIPVVGSNVWFWLTCSFPAA